MTKIIDPSILQMSAAYLFILILIMIVRVKGIPREREILIATTRMTIQLILVGYLLAYIFDHSHPVFSVVIVLLMEIFAIFNVYKRIKTPLSSDLKKVIAVSMSLGTVSSLLYFLLVVLTLSPWYEPRYFIPIAGMLIGNSMTGISLGVARLTEGMSSQKDVIETALMLGATPKKAAKSIIDSAFDSAILPTVNSMVGMGIVFLPGMMTGQILSGSSPLLAIKYQIAIMLGVMGSVSLSVVMFVEFGYKTFFNKYNQLKQL